MTGGPPWARPRGRAPAAGTGLNNALNLLRMNEEDTQPCWSKAPKSLAILGSAVDKIVWSSAINRTDRSLSREISEIAGQPLALLPTDPTPFLPPHPSPRPTPPSHLHGSKHNRELLASQNKAHVHARRAGRGGLACRGGHGFGLLGNVWLDGGRGGRGRPGRVGVQLGGRVRRRRHRRQRRRVGGGGKVARLGRDEREEEKEEVEEGRSGGLSLFCGRVARKPVGPGAGALLKSGQLRLSRRGALEPDQARGRHKLRASCRPDQTDGVRAARRSEPRSPRRRDASASGGRLSVLLGSDSIQMARPERERAAGRRTSMQRGRPVRRRLDHNIENRGRAGAPRVAGQIILQPSPRVTVCCQ